MSRESELVEVYQQRLAAWSDISDHMQFMREMAHGEIVELGVRSGNSTAAFLAGLYESEFGGHLWSIDIEDIFGHPAWYRSGMWTPISKTDDLTARECVPETYTLLFIDTSHHFNQTLDELRLYGPGAYCILMHDTDLEHPHAAPRKDPAFPVRAAINTWLAELDTPRDVTYREGSYGMAVIHR